MYEIIVLGLIPGTEIQVTFFGWLMTLLGAIGAKLAVIMRKKHSLLWLRLYMELLILPFRIIQLRQQRA